MILQRPLIQQQFTNFAVTLAAANIAQPIKPNGAINDLIDSFIVSLDAAAANSVFVGDANVTVTTGIEITVGNSVLFDIQQVRQLFELQQGVDNLTRNVLCEKYTSGMIPFICWNLSQVYLVAAAATNVRIMTFPNPYIQ